MKTKNELTALQNSINYYKIDATIKLFFESDKRKKTKFVLTQNDKFFSPKMNYNEMNRFIFGIAMAKEVKF
ncbi:hypothetical protein AVT43_gp70 [Polaribacter phage P12002L]|uniref:Uncharacterized protein n=2 Tax=Incheonvirus TaxID=2976977 RepID=A0A0F7ILM1_9CAUD|nr:hypothetical protein AVT42_gp72 [Polaribacter phage P12002S]YP_009209730.1 hypothetical protein AVT43_gp70 [Polaribacter phage P12002L]AKG94244.1 hypothetical protein P12002L_0070 [Polaribacter phage P12002L]AKG94328.1 hypothetical protein P12002S_0072 [Polaribacter phage P12002S]